MKKVLSLLMVGVMTFSVLAGVASAESNTKKEIKKEKTAEAQAKKAEKKAEFDKKKADIAKFKDEIKPLIQKIKENRKTVVSLQKLLKDSHKAAKANIKVLKKSDIITPEVLENIKTYLKQIKALRTEFAQTAEPLKDSWSKYKEAKSAKNYEAMKNSLSLIMVKQEARIATITKITDVYSKIAALKVSTVAVANPAPVTSTTP